MANDKIEFSTKIDTKELIKELKHAQDLLLKFGDSSKTAEKEINTSLKKVIENLNILENETQDVENKTKELNNNLKNIGSKINFSTLSNSFDGLKNKIINVTQNITDLNKKVYDLGKKTVDGLKNSFIALGGAVAGIVGTSIKVGSEFEAIITDVGVLSGLALDGTQEALNQMQALEDKAKEIGRTTQFSAVQAGQGFKTMAMAGYDAEEMLNALPSAMSLAGATGEDLTLVIDRMVNNLNAFGLSSKDSKRYADVLATATTKVTTNVAELTEAFLEAGTISNAFGINIEDTSIVLGIWADNGLKASKAGTSYKNVLLGLNAPTKEAQKLMEQYNIQVLKNADGSTDLINTLLDMGDKLRNVDDATKANILTTIVGREAYAGLNILLNTSRDRFEELGEAIYNSSGQADKMAELMLDNLQGQLTILKSSLEGLQLAIFDNIAPITKKGVKFLNDSLNEVTKAIEKGEINRVPEILGGIISKAFINIGDTIPTFIDTISNSITAFFSTLLQDTSKLSTIGTNIITSLLDGIRQQIPNLYTLIQTLAPTIATYFLQWSPMLVEIGITLITGFVDGLGSNPQHVINTITTVINNLINTIVNNLPTFLEKGLALILAITEGIVQNMPIILDALINIINQLIITIVNNLPQFLEKGMELIISMAQGIGQKSGVLVSKIIELIASVIKILIDNLPQFIKAGAEFILGLVKGVISQIPNLLGKIGELAQSVLNAIANGFKSILEIGKNLVLGLWEGIKSAWSNLVGWVGNLANGLVSSVKGIFGIRSPSRVFKEIGIYIDEGLSEGIQTGKDQVIDTAKKMANDVINTTNDEFSNVDNIKLDTDITTDNAKKFLDVKQNILDEAINLEKDYINKIKEIKEEEKKLIEETNKAYIQQIDLLKQLYSDPIQSDILTNNKDLQLLSNRGLDNNIISQLDKLGHTANDQIQVLLSMTDEKLKEYELVWITTYNNINQSVLDEMELLKTNNNNKLEEIKEETKQKIQETNEEYKNDLIKFKEETSTILNNLPVESLQIGGLIAKNIEQGFQNVIPSVKNTIMSTINNLINEARSILSNQLNALSQQAQNTISTFYSYANNNAYAYAGSFATNGISTRAIENTNNYINNRNNTINQTITFANNENLSPYESAKKIKNSIKNIL